MQPLLPAPKILSVLVNNSNRYVANFVWTYLEFRLWGVTMVWKIMVFLAYRKTFFTTFCTKIVQEKTGTMGAICQGVYLVYLRFAYIMHV